MDRPQDELPVVVPRGTSRPLAPPLGSALRWLGSVDPGTPVGRAVAGWPMGPTGMIPVRDVCCPTTSSYPADLRSTLLLATDSSSGCGPAPYGGDAIVVGSRFSQLGTQILGKSSFSISFRIS